MEYKMTALCDGLLTNNSYLKYEEMLKDELSTLKWVKSDEETGNVAFTYAKSIQSFVPRNALVGRMVATVFITWIEDESGGYKKSYYTYCLGVKGKHFDKSKDAQNYIESMWGKILYDRYYKMWKKECHAWLNNVIKEVGVK